MIDIAARAGSALAAVVLALAGDEAENEPADSAASSKSEWMAEAFRPVFLKFSELTVPANGAIKPLLVPLYTAVLPMKLLTGAEAVLQLRFMALEDSELAVRPLGAVGSVPQDLPPPPPLPESTLLMLSAGKVKLKEESETLIALCWIRIIPPNPRSARESTPKGIARVESPAFKVRARHTET